MQPDAEWDKVGSSMVAELLAGSLPKGLPNTPDSSLLERMTTLCLRRLREQQQGGVMRKCELGTFLKTALGNSYRRGWLKVVLDALRKQGLVHTTASEVAVSCKGTGDGLSTPVVGGGAVQWCNFLERCKYLLNVEAHPKHFDSFLHLCPVGLRCRHVTAYLLGQGMSDEALRHFRRWKHVCPQGRYCVYYADAGRYRDHFTVFTHRNLENHGFVKKHCAFQAAVPHV